MNYVSFPTEPLVLYTLYSLQFDDMSVRLLLYITLTVVSH